MATVLLTPTIPTTFESNLEHTLSLLDGCSNMEGIKKVHAQFLKTGLIMYPTPASKLLSATIDCGDLAYARSVFDRISSSDAVIWNTMIRGYSNSNKPEEALNLYFQMLHDSVLHNSYTFPFILKACSSLSAFEETKQIHAKLVKMSFGWEVYASNSLLHVYVISSRVESARVLFDRLPQRDVVSWNTMIGGYMKWGNIKMAYEMFKAMPVRNVISWTAMISGFVREGMNKEALNLFREMFVAGVKPDGITLASSLAACAELGALDEGKWIHSYIERNGIKIDSVLGCVLVAMYAKSADMKEAKEVFRKLKKKCVSAWTAMIDGFSIHGQGREAIDWFIQMQKAGIKPNPITFSVVLTACSHAGLVKEGKSIFESMRSEHKLKPSIEHYGCMVDLLGRAGLLNEAEDFIANMPFKPNAAIWGALHNACRIHGNLDCAKQIGKLLVELDPENSGRYIHLASIHAMAGEWEQAVKVRSQMKHQGVSKLPGCSMISVNGIVHNFFAGSGSHTQMEEI